jgi:PPOX class probable F420-dependent enzyme
MALPILDLSVSAVREVGSEGQFGGEVEGLDNPDVQEADAMRERVRTARVARLATIDPDGRPHLVPIVFVLDGQSLYSAVDAKPKRSRKLRRVANARERSAVTVLVDHYEDDWGRLWWVSLRGRGRVLDTGVEAERALRLLADKYEQYRRERPGRPVLAVDILEWRSWDASASA